MGTSSSRARALRNDARPTAAANRILWNIQAFAICCAVQCLAR